jgi:hypothetical protein
LPKIKPTTHWKREEVGEGDWEYNREGKFVQGTVYACMKLSQ